MLKKIDASLNERLGKIEWGEYTYASLFNLIPIKRKLDKTAFTNNGKTPVFSAESTNNGIMGYTDFEADYMVSKENPIYVVFGDHTRSFNIAKENFCVADNVKVLLPKIKLPINTLLFITSAWKKSIENKGYKRHWSIAQNVKFKLPIKDGKIDFDFMESFVAELEAYLSVTGLKDTHLLPEEEQALSEYSKIVFKDYKLTDVFDVKNTGNILSRDIVENSGTTPYLCASAENNAVSTYISYDNNLKNSGNCIFIGGKTFVVTYQEKDFFSNDSHNIALYLKNEKYKVKLLQVYLATCVYKSLSHKYSWGDSISNKKAQKDYISLPTKDGRIDYDCMKTLISAIQKLVIKDVVSYSDRKIATTKTLIGNE